MENKFSLGKLERLYLLSSPHPFPLENKALFSSNLLQRLNVKISSNIITSQKTTKANINTVSPHHLAAHKSN